MSVLVREGLFCDAKQEQNAENQKKWIGMSVTVKKHVNPL